MEWTKRQFVYIKLKKKENNNEHYLKQVIVYVHLNLEHHNMGIAFDSYIFILSKFAFWKVFNIEEARGY